jgi:hypothetical protein
VASSTVVVDANRRLAEAFRGAPWTLAMADAKINHRGLLLILQPHQN